MKGEMCLCSDAIPALPAIVRRHKLAGEKCVFITTASETIKPGRLACYIHELRLLRSLGLDVDKISLTGLSPEQVRRHLSSARLVYGAGGDVHHLSVQMRRVGFDNIIGDFVNDGNVYASDSAASVIMGRRTDIGYSPGYFRDISHVHRIGFGFTDKSLLVHWGTPEYQKQYDRYPRGTHTVDALPLSDNEALIINRAGEKVVRFVQ